MKASARSGDAGAAGGALAASRGLVLASPRLVARGTGFPVYWDPAGRFARGKRAAVLPRALSNGRASIAARNGRGETWEDVVGAAAVMAAEIPWPWDVRVGGGGRGCKKTARSGVGERGENIAVQRVSTKLPKFSPKIRSRLSTVDARHNFWEFLSICRLMTPTG